MEAEHPMQMFVTGSGITDLVCTCGPLVEERAIGHTMVFLNGGTLVVTCSGCGKRAERRVPPGTEMPMEPIDDLRGALQVMPDAPHVVLFRRANLIINFMDATGGRPHMKAGRCGCCTN
jgi:hypothetical protein